MTRQSFVYGTLVLLLASLFNRVIGFFYQILLIRLIQPEGVGLFNMVYPVYVMALVLASAGIPVAIAKLVAEEVALNNLRGAYRIFYISLTCITINSLLFTGLLIVGAPLLQTHIFPHPKVYYCFLALIPAILVVSLCSALRGFFQGLQQMVPTAVTQAVEQIVRVTTGLALAFYLLPKGVEYAAVGVSLGIVCGEFAGFVFMLWIFLVQKPQVTGFIKYTREPLFSSTGRIFHLALPVTLTRFTSTALLSIDALVIPRRLQACGMTFSEATATYGQFVGIAETLLFTPAIVTISLATALIPAISEALARKNMPLVEARIEEAVRLTMLAGVPAIVIFFILPTELCTLFFGYAQASVPLTILSMGGLFLYLQQTTTGVLHGLGRADKPLKNLVVASLFKFAGIYYLTALPGIDIRGTAASMVTGYIIMSMLNYLDLKKITGLHLDWKYCLGKPLFGGVGMAAIMWQVKLNIPILIDSPLIQFVLILLSGIITYFLLLFLSGGLHIYDINRLRSLLKIR